MFETLIDVTIAQTDYSKLSAIVSFVLLVGLSSCHIFHKSDAKPGMPLVGFSFSKNITNDGILNIQLQKDVSFDLAVGVTDSCLNLSATAEERNPIFFRFPDQYNMDDYEGFSVFIWVKKQINDTEDYTISGHYSIDSTGNYTGWKLMSSGIGSWRWEMSDGHNKWQYNPGYPRQRIDDTQWHLIGFSYNKNKKEVRQYYDGLNVAVISVEGCDSMAHNGVFAIGVDPDSFEKRRDLFNGYLDDFYYWGRPIMPNEVLYIYENATNKKVRVRKLAGNKFSVMTWNIYHGGEYLGKSVGIERIVDIIQNNGADIVCMQETYNSGAKIADRLGYQFYKRSDNISLISRFPIGETYNVYKKEHSGGVRINLDDTRSVIVMPTWLSPQPDISAYLKSGLVNIDSLLIWEQKSRGYELRFILSEVPRFIKDQNEPVILAGNFNTGSHLDWTERNKVNNNGIVIPFSLTKNLEDAGYIDSYRKVHPDEVLFPGNTWSPLFREILSNRIDFIFYKGSEIKPVESRVVNYHRLGFPSDHALVMTEFEISE